MADDLDERAKYYAVRLRESEEFAANATDGETLRMWEGVAEGYRMLLSNLKSRKQPPS
jgi:hypothetical protein